MSLSSAMSKRVLAVVTCSDAPETALAVDSVRKRDDYLSPHDCCRRCLPPTSVTRAWNPVTLISFLIMLGFESE